MRNHRRRSGVALSLLVLTAACAGAPAYRAPSVPLPERVGAEPRAWPGAERRSTDGRPAAEATAWRELGDTTLSRLIEQALRTNLDLSAAESRIRAARALRTQATLDYAPTVTFAAGYTRQRIASAAFPIGAGSFPDQDIWDGGFDAGWELDVFGRIRRSVQAEGAFVAAASEDLRNLQVTLTAEIARAYFELRGTQEQLAVARRNAENQRRTLEVTEQRLEAGRGTGFDTERAKAQLSTTLSLIPPLEARVAAAEYRIAVLVGRPPSELMEALEVAASLPRLPELALPLRADSLIVARPDVAAAERRLAAEGALVGAAKAELLPRLSVGGSVGYSAGSFGAVGDEGSFRYAVGPVLSWPAFNLGRVKARVDLSRAREAEARAQYDQTVLLALEEVQATLARYQSSTARVERVQEAATASERAAELARLRYAEGVADFLQVLDAERTLLEAENRLAESRVEAATAYAALYKALGGKGLPLTFPE